MNIYINIVAFRSVLLLNIQFACFILFDDGNYDCGCGSGDDSKDNVDEFNNNSIKLLYLSACKQLAMIDERWIYAKLKLD
jgi:hypothetical protein